MYFVDKEKLTQKLTYLQGLTEDYDKNKENHYAYERIAQMLIESSLDIGNMIIDGFISVSYTHLTLPTIYSV